MAEQTEDTKQDETQTREGSGAGADIETSDERGAGPIGEPGSGKIGGEGEGRQNIGRA